MMSHRTRLRHQIHSVIRLGSEVVVRLPSTSDVTLQKMKNRRFFDTPTYELPSIRTLVGEPPSIKITAVVLGRRPQSTKELLVIEFAPTRSSPPRPELCACRTLF